MYISEKSSTFAAKLLKSRIPTNMAQVTFETLNSKAKLFAELKSGKYAWWEKVKANPDLYIEIRKDNNINVYYQGGSVIRLHYCSRHKRVQAFTHAKYLNGKGKDYIECADQLDDILDRIIASIPKYYSQKKGTNKKNWSEKFIQSQYILKDHTLYLDSEFAYKEDPYDIRVDLIECTDGIIRFVELKRLDDGRMLKKSDDSPEVVDQVNSYRRFIQEYEARIIEYYHKLWIIKNELNLPNTCEPMEVSKEPLLLIFNRWPNTNPRREEHTRRMEEILQRNNIDYVIESEICML